MKLDSHSKSSFQSRMLFRSDAAGVYEVAANQRCG